MVPYQPCLRRLGQSSIQMDHGAVVIRKRFDGSLLRKRILTMIDGVFEFLNRHIGWIIALSI